MTCNRESARHAPKCMSPTVLREPLYLPDVRAPHRTNNIRMPPRTEPISPRHLPIRGRRGFKSDTTPTKLLKRIVQAGAIVGDSKLDRHETRCLHAVSWCERGCQHPVDHPARMHYIELLLEAAQYHEFLQARSTLEKEVSSYECGSTRVCLRVLESSLERLGRESSWCMRCMSMKILRYL